MLIAGLTIALLIGVVSAAVIQHFGQVQMTANVKQAVLLDGKDINSMPIEETATVAGGESFCKYHWLQSQTSVPVQLQFETWGPDLNGITVTYLKSVKYSYSKDWEVPAVGGVLHVTVEDTGDGWLKWTYTYAANPTHRPKMTVGINYPEPDSFGITTFDDSEHDGWYYVTMTTEQRFADYSGGTYEDWVITSASGNVLTVSIKKTALPGTFTWMGYANYNGQQVWIEIDTTTWTPTGLITLCGEPITSQFTLEPGERLDFYIKYEFAENIQGGTYDIYSTVKPA
jgi:hypothetical protein